MQKLLQKLFRITYLLILNYFSIDNMLGPLNLINTVGFQPVITTNCQVSSGVGSGREATAGGCDCFSVRNA